VSPNDQRPVVALAMDPSLVPALFDREVQHRLAQLARIDLARVHHGVLSPDHLDPETEVLLTCWGAPRLDEEALAALPKLRAVIHAAGSVKEIVTDACRDRGIEFASAASVNAVPVAEYTLAMVLLVNKRVFSLVRTYQELRSSWHGGLVPPEVGGYGPTVGICGASLIGRRVIDLLRPFDVTVLLNDPFVSPDEAAALGVELVELDELCERSDVLSLHAPALPSTRHLIDARRLGLMRDGATLINTARGMLVDTAALSAELVSGRLCAVLDHTEPEILPADSPLYDLPNVFLTPHIAGSLGNELRRMGYAALHELAGFVAKRPFHNPVRYVDLDRSA
jgi:phosphoglycerate dehydrogenase-like enzyme